MGGDVASADVPLKGKTRGQSTALSVPKFAAVVLQLGLVMWGLYLFQIEASSGFLRLVPLIIGGFIVNAWLPMALRRPFFVMLSLAAIYLIFGLVNSLWLIGIGLALIGLCHLPAPKWLRVTLVFIAGAGLTAMRADWFTTSWSTAILPVLGSMFMFRLALYLYDMDSEKKESHALGTARLFLHAAQHRLPLLSHCRLYPLSQILL